MEKIEQPAEALKLDATGMRAEKLKITPQLARAVAVLDSLKAVDAAQPDERLRGMLRTLVRAEVTRWLMADDASDEQRAWARTNWRTGWVVAADLIHDFAVLHDADLGADADGWSFDDAQTLMGKYLERAIAALAADQ